MDKPVFMLHGNKKPAVIWYSLSEGFHLTHQLVFHNDHSDPAFDMSMNQMPVPIGTFRPYNPINIEIVFTQMTKD